ncbi:MAG: class I SAM-dependent methyltransferase [Dehalococcoidales bacterium]|nr:class I SAM-dependent methyltransferase [Dehalococcoidales bacterium]
MDKSKYIKAWKDEERQPFTGWDFSYLDGRMLEEQAPWSYTTRAAELMDHATSVIDLGTGGGERLLKLKEHWPAKVVATEAYPPNLKLASQTLGHLGVQVVDVSQNMFTVMPFSDGEFDLVLNRHSGFNPREVPRILAHGGTYLSQQIHGMTFRDLKVAFGEKHPYSFAVPEFFLPQLESAGMTVTDLREWEGRITFTDVGALVYYLKAVPWMVTGFSVDTHKEYLFKLQDRIDKGEKLVFTQKRYLFEARKD